MNASETFNDASLVMPRMIEPCDKVLERLKPSSPQTWLTNWNDAKKDVIQNAADAGMKTCMGLNSTDGSKYPSVLGVISSPTDVALPSPPWAAQNVSKAFVRIAEVGIDSLLDDRFLLVLKVDRKK